MVFKNIFDHIDADHQPKISHDLSVVLSASLQAQPAKSHLSN